MYKSRLLMTAAVLLTMPASAETATIEQRLDALQKMVLAQQAQITAQKAEIAALKHQPVKKGKAVSDAASAPLPPPPAPPADPVTEQLATQQAKIDALTMQLETDENSARLAKQEAPVWSLAGGRPTITSADGRFSLAIRALVQYDQAYYMQGAKALTLGAANGPDLSSGGNFRRAWFGVQGKLFGDWSYYFNYDFAGSGTEGPGHIQQVWLQYDGIPNVAVRFGAFATPSGLEDMTGSGDTIFLERTAPADAARNLAGGDGRDGVSVTYADDRWYAALTYAGNKIQDSGAFDEQQSGVGRLAALAYSDDAFKVLLSAGGAYVFKPQDVAAGSSVAAGGTISINSAPELTVDDNAIKFVNTGAIAADHAWQWGLEAASEWNSLYAQGGYFRYGIDLRTAKSAYGFSGWYALASYMLTGESKPYLPASGAFGNPKPRIPFSFNGGGWGAWELAARFSDLDFNDQAGVLGKALPAGGLRGGDQKIWTLGLNWYPVSAVKFAFQYENIAIVRIGTRGTTSNSDVGQTLNTIALRTQVAL
jgi:phosphate-selective porin OprO/OprP